MPSAFSDLRLDAPPVAPLCTLQFTRPLHHPRILVCFPAFLTCWIGSRAPYQNLASVLLFMVVTRVRTVDVRTDCCTMRPSLLLVCRSPEALDIGIHEVLPRIFKEAAA